MGLCFIAVLLAMSLNIYEAQKGTNEAPLVKVKQGFIKGLKEASLDGKDFYSYYGIPYAEPPIKSLRFKEPVPKTSWNGIHDGTKVPQGCPSNVFYDVLKEGRENLQVFGEEDCLILNVFVPQVDKSNSKLAVMVLLPGGGFFTGTTYEFSPYVLMNEDIIFVSIQYRLNILGFLSTEDEILPGNMGLKDQQLGLKWVRENIESFGGDPNQVTIFGESAGGTSVHHHILSPGSKGLFQRAIMQSGTSITHWSYQTNSLRYAKAAGDYVNCSLDNGTQNYLECMQSADLNELVIFSTISMGWEVFPLPFIPRVDGVFLPDLPEVLLKKRIYNKVDVISGSVRNEGALLMSGIAINPLWLSRLNTNFSTYGPKSLAIEKEENSLDLTYKAYRYYLNRTDVTIGKEDFDNLEKLLADRSFKVGQYITDVFLSRDPDLNLYIYEMDYLGSVYEGKTIPGYDRRDWVNHQDDLHYLFGGGPRFTQMLKTESDFKVRKFFVSAWTNFAKYGNPNIESLPCNCTWERATADNFRRLSIKEFPEMVNHSFPEVENFWCKLKTVQNKILFNV